MQSGTTALFSDPTEQPWPLERPAIQRARILLADDHEVVRKGIRSILERRPDWEVCGEAATGRKAVEMAADLSPDVVILDIGLPELNGLDAARQIVSALPATEVVVLTVHESETLVHEVLDAGARGYVLKSDAGECLVEAVESVLQRTPYLTPRISRALLRAYLGGPPPADAERKNVLTAREREVLQLLAEGRSNKEVASLLDISVKTAETHRTNIMRKLDVHRVADLVRYAIRTGLVDP
jgi:DNA-binding NarL/FixJ family response regulator